MGPRAGAENLAHTGIRFPDRPARSESLYRLSYPGPNPYCTECTIGIGDSGVRLYSSRPCDCIQGKPENGMWSDSVLPLCHGMEQIFKSFIISKSGLTGQSC